MAEMVPCPKCEGVEFHGLCALCDGELEIAAEDSVVYTLMGSGAGRTRWIRARRRRLGLREFGLKVEEAEADGKVKVLRTGEPKKVATVIEVKVKKTPGLVNSMRRFLTGRDIDG